MRWVKCVAHGGGRADVGIGPYEKTGSGSVGADFISARAAAVSDAPPRTQKSGAVSFKDSSM